MKIGIITKTNQKGQIVIPKAMREELGIDADVPLNLALKDNGIYIHPVNEVFASKRRESSYLDILKKTQGTWAKENWATLKKKRRKIELTASRKRKRKW
jgi:AbrB family looped-hinge helix DNA binding protein